MGRRRINLEPFKQQIIHLYEDIGSTQSDIAKLFGVSMNTIAKRLRKWGVKTRNHGANYRVRHHALNKIGPNEAYWLGMISADGCVSQRDGRADEIILYMAEKETDAVFNFRDMFSPDQPIRGQIHTNYTKKDGTHPRFRRLQICSQPLSDRLTELGIENAKTHSVEPHQTMLNCVYFWRGIFDGDGCFTTQSSSSRPRAKVKMGSEKMIIAARDFFASFGLGTGNITIHEFESDKHKDTFCVEFNGQDAVDVALLLYGDGTRPLRSDFTFRKLHRARVMATTRPDLYEQQTFYDVWDDHANMLNFPYYRNGLTERYADQVEQDRDTQEQFEMEAL